MLVRWQVSQRFLIVCSSYRGNPRAGDLGTFSTVACPKRKEPGEEENLQRQKNKIEEEEEVIEEDDAFLPPGATSTAGLRRLPYSNIFVGSAFAANREAQAAGEACFVKSSFREDQCPSDGLPEFALVGRSNVGKSSLVNALIRKRLAKTSKTPGKTQAINHFLIDKRWYLVDLPGYGFANAPSNIRVSWDTFTKDYFLSRKTLVSVLLLVDASVPPKQMDLQYADWLTSNKIPLTLVFTKCDKRRTRNKDPSHANVKAFLQKLKHHDGKLHPWIMTSCVKSFGISEVLIHLAHLRDYWSR